MAVPDGAAMHAMMQQIIQTVTNLGQRVDSASGRIGGTGNLDEINITLADLELKINEFNTHRTHGGVQGAGMSIALPLYFT